MKKLEKDLYIKHAKRLQAILDEKSTFVRFLGRKDFSAIIKNELNVLCACEKLFPKVDLDAKYSSKALVKAFNKLTKESFKLDEKFKYEDETDLIDAINYLYTFCNNMFRVNIDDVVSGKQVTATDPHIDLKAKPEFDDAGPRMNSNFAFAGAGIPLAATPYENPYLVGKAYAKIQDDMRQGKFYRFKTKPKIIPIVKWASIVLTILLIAALLVCAIFSFMANSIEVTTGTDTGPLNLISNGVFYVIAGAFGGYPLYLTMKNMFGKNKNINVQYYFNWGFVMIFLVLALVFGLMDTISMWSNNFTPTQAAMETSRYAPFIGLKVSLLIVLSLIGVSIVPIVIAGIKNPKPDTEAIERRVKEYIDMFTAESGQMPVPPKADVQKPKDVKESKKDSKSKKPDKK